MRRTLLSCVVMVWALLTGLVTVPATAADQPVTCEISDILVNSCRPWLGASAGKYPGVDDGVRAQLEAHEKRIGRPLDIVHSYHPPGQVPLSRDERYFISRPGTMAFINWKPASSWSDAAGGNRAVNARIDEAADAFLSVAPHKVFLTLWHEPENDVSVDNCAPGRERGAGSPADYRAMWRNVQDRFAARGVDNVVWVMDYMNYERWDCLVDDLWPGNDRVDWILFNAYGGSTNADFVANLGRFYDLLTQTSDATHDYLAKPWGIAEWNIRNPTVAEGVSYYRRATEALEANMFPRLKAYLVFDNVGPEGNENRVAYAQNRALAGEKQRAYNAFANHRRLVGDGGAGSDTLAPTATLSVPTRSGVVGGQVSVRADAVDNVGVQSVQLQVDGRDVGPGIKPPFWSATLRWNSTSVADGEHDLRVVVRDAAGNLGRSPVLRVRVDNGVAEPPLPVN